MTFYTSDGNSYTGMTQDTIIRLRLELGKDTIFIDEIAFNTLISRKQNGL